MIFLPDKQVTKKERLQLINSVDELLSEMQVTGETIDFQTVSEKLGVARSTLYRNLIVREKIAAAREKSKLQTNILSTLQKKMEELESRIYFLEQKITELKG
ncbi:MAG: hypothetical protein JW971_01310 [Synergistales bacterium]|nr:hypothetical protein [Synergistales bacterium]